jgi:hypothetical protein
MLSTSQDITFCPSGDIVGAKCLIMEHAKEGRYVASSRTISDVLLRKPATAPVPPPAAKQTPSNAPTSSHQGSQVPATTEESISQQLRDQGWTEAGISAAMYTVKQRTGKVSLQDCMNFLQQYSYAYKRQDIAPRATQTLELDPPGKPPQPLSQAPLTTSWKTTVAAPALDFRAELKSMGYTDQQVDAAVTRGCSDLDACLQYLLSAESSSKASSHTPAPAPSPGSGGGGATTSSKMVISCDERQLVYMDCALFNPVPPSTVTLTRV